MSAIRKAAPVLFSRHLRGVFSGEFTPAVLPPDVIRLRREGLPAGWAARGARVKNGKNLLVLQVTLKLLVAKA